MALTTQLVLFAACSDSKEITAPPVVTPDPNPPAIQREMRGLWVATVANIDWPSRTTLTPTSSARSSCEHSRSCGGGRIQRDLCFRSDRRGRRLPVERSSRGLRCSPARRGPIPATIRSRSPCRRRMRAASSCTRGSTPFAPETRPTPLGSRRRICSGRGATWCVCTAPALARSRASRRCTITSCASSRDIVQRYDVDGIHADDYFYPYPADRRGESRIEFPGQRDLRAERRRPNDRPIGVARTSTASSSACIARCTRSSRRSRSGSRRSASGVRAVRTASPASTRTPTIYADSRKWLQRGLGRLSRAAALLGDRGAAAELPALLDWWLAQNARGRHVWPGLAAYRVGDGTSSAFGAERDPEAGQPNAHARRWDRPPAVQHDVDADAWRWRRGGVVGR